MACQPQAQQQITTKQLTSQVSIIPFYYCHFSRKQRGVCLCVVPKSKRFEPCNSPHRAAHVSGARPRPARTRPGGSRRERCELLLTRRQTRTQDETQPVLIGANCANGHLTKRVANATLGAGFNSLQSPFRHSHRRAARHSHRKSRRHTPGRIIMVVEASRAERAAPASATSRSWSARNPWRCTTSSSLVPGRSSH